ncbi:MAG: helix-turn-helix domain-containing protein [Acidimicrobiaceae bacterium]|nr:helix-turn-helix domain-containing protein [Acidimicrobiaceae bacterium]
MSFADQLREARENAGLSQAQLARLAGTSQPRVSSYESGAVTPSAPTRARLLAAARPLPGEALDRHREEIKRVARRCRVRHVRVFGSVARWEDTYNSDIDLVVTPLDDASLLDLTHFALEVQGLTGYPVDVVSDRGRNLDDPVLVEAQEL